MGFRLRYLRHDLELPLGKFVIGRSPECQLSLDDPLVSRTHALLRVTEDAVVLQDLDSRNGVFVNGAKLSHSCRLNSGDRVSIGSQEMVVVAQPGAFRSSVNAGPPSSNMGRATVTSSSRAGPESVRGSGIASTRRSDAAVARPPTDGNSATRQDAFQLLRGIADKALAMGRADEAERILSAMLLNVFEALKAGKEVDTSTVDQAGLYAARLASATGKASWADFVIDVHAAARRPCAAPTIDELHSVLRKVKTLNVASLRAYVKLLRENTSDFGPAERFLVQRMEGLERLAVHQ